MSPAEPLDQRSHPPDPEPDTERDTEPENHARATDRRTRTRAYAFGFLAVGALGGLVAASRPWWQGAADGSTVTFTGTESSAGLAQAVPFVLLAGTLLALALRARGRSAVGVLLAAAAAGGVVAGVLRPEPPAELVLTRLQAVTLGDSSQLAPTAWSYVFAAVSLLALAGALLMVLHGRHWPSRAGRFERAAQAAAVPVEEQSDAALWSALDAGIDPTDVDTRRDDPPAVAAGSDAAPIRTSPGDGVTMALGATRPAPARSSRSGPADGADHPAAPAAGPAGLDTDVGRAATGPPRPGSEGEQSS